MMEQQEDNRINDNMELTISTEKIVEFFTDKKIPIECNLCQNKHWLVLQEIKNEMPSLAFLDENYNVRSGLGVGLLMCNCSNCGNTRLFLRKIIVDWLSDKNIVEYKEETLDGAGV